MDIAPYIRLVRKWLWLIIMLAILGGGLGFISKSQQVPVYSAHSTLSVGQYLQNPNPTSNEILIGLNLVETYQQLAVTRDILQGVVDTLKVNIPPEYLRPLISTNVIPNTSLLVLTVTYVDPVLTADIANALANELILQSPTNLTAAQQAQIDLANEQIQALSDQINTQRTQSDQLQRQIEVADTSSEIDDLNQRRNHIVEQMNEAAGAIAQFQTNITVLQERTNALAIVERAVIPTTPVIINPFTTILLGIVIGMGAAIALALTVEYFDDKLRTSEIATQVLGLPVLGLIPRFGKRRGGYAEHLITNFPSLSEVTEAYRRLRTNLIFLQSNNSSQNIFIITSSGPGEGKTLTSANLAVTMASAGMRVLLIDADLRRPSLHDIFNLENKVGLTTLLFAVPKEDENVTQSSDLNECLQATQVANLKVVTSGFLPSNPAEVLGSILMKRWIDAFRASTNFDMILIDTPPASMFTDSSILAAVANAGVLLVIDSEHTRRKLAQKACDQLTQVGAQVSGLIINRANPREEQGYYGNGYYRDYYQPRPAVASKRRFPGFVKRSKGEMIGSNK